MRPQPHSPFAKQNYDIATTATNEESFLLVCTVIFTFHHLHKHSFPLFCVLALVSFLLSVHCLIQHDIRYSVDQRDSHLAAILAFPLERNEVSILCILLTEPRT